MGTLNRLCHSATRLLAENHHGKFLKSTKDIESAQKHQLSRILASCKDAPAHQKAKLDLAKGYKDFAAKVQPSTYEDWKGWVDSREKGLSGLSSSKLERYQPTSGSTSEIKWIPYTELFLSEINSALMPWIGSMYKSHPGIRSGYHYWSVSWVPTALRADTDENVNDDLRMLPFWKRFIAERYMAVPETVSLASTSDDTLFATVAFLLSRQDLSFMSVWSPTFSLALIDAIWKYKEELSVTLRSGEWQGRAQSLKHSVCPKSLRAASLLRDCPDTIERDFLKALWPDLSLISCWDTSSSKSWADSLAALFPEAKIQGKGLWATEGALTIPMNGKYPLAINSHFYEFSDIATGQILPAWELEQGMEVTPLITNGSGFLRYHLKDKLRVTGHINQCPCLEFEGRMDGVDLVGEKISHELAHKITQSINDKFDVKITSLLAIPGNQLQASGLGKTTGCYVLLCEMPQAKNFSLSDVEIYLESLLIKSFHYNLARDLGQLSEARVVFSDQPLEIYRYRCKERGMAEGNIKVEPLVLWNTSMPNELAQSLEMANESWPYIA